MNVLINISRSIRSFGVARVVWLALALIHAAPLFAVSIKLIDSPSATGFVSLGLLAAVSVFFWAKAVDVAWLRADRPWAELGVWLLAGALMHPVGGESVPQALLVPPAVALVAATVVSARKSHNKPRFAPDRGFGGWFRCIAGVASQLDNAFQLFVTAARRDGLARSRCLAHELRSRLIPAGLAVLPPPTR